MNICAEFEREKDGRWVAMLPGFREVSGYGWTRHEAVVGLTVRALHVLADRAKSGQIEVEDDPVGVLLSRTRDELSNKLIAFVFGLESGHTPNAETIAAIEELESGGGESAATIEELFAKLNADD
jgi:hypothetical protein